MRSRHYFRVGIFVLLSLVLVTNGYSGQNSNPGGAKNNGQSLNSGGVNNNGKGMNPFTQINNELLLINQNIAEIFAEINSILTRVGTLEGKVTDLENKVTELELVEVSLQEQITSVLTLAESNGVDIESILLKIENMQLQIADIKEDVDENGLLSKENAVKIAALKDEVNSALDSIDGSLRLLVSGQIAIGNLIDLMIEKINDMNEKIALMEDDISGKQDDISGACHGSYAIQQILDDGSIICVDTNESEVSSNRVIEVVKDFITSGRTVTRVKYCKLIFFGFCLDHGYKDVTGPNVYQDHINYCPAGYVRTSSYVKPTNLTVYDQYAYGQRGWLIKTYNSTTSSQTVRVRNTCLATTVK